MSFTASIAALRAAFQIIKSRVITRFSAIEQIFQRKYIACFCAVA
jgi:hypothetical protein